MPKKNNTLPPDGEWETQDAPNVKEGQTEDMPDIPAPETADDGEIVLHSEFERLQEQHLRLRAEYENYRRRTIQEKQAAYENAKLDVVASYLPLYDNLLRAAAQPCADEPYAQGIQMLTRQLSDILTGLGVSEIPALGEPFDPEMHNAISHVEDPELGANVVAEVFQQGFRTERRIVRLAMVKVAN